MQEILIILVVALVVVGPRKLPQLAKGLGKGLQEFRRATDEIKESISQDETFKEFKSAKDSLDQSMADLDVAEALDVDFDEILEPKKPKTDMEGRKALLAEIASEHEEAETAASTEEVAASEAEEQEEEEAAAAQPAEADASPPPAQAASPEQGLAEEAPPADEEPKPAKQDA